MKCKHRWFPWEQAVILGYTVEKCSGCDEEKVSLSPAGVGLWLVALLDAGKSSLDRDYRWGYGLWIESIVEGSVNEELT